MSKAIKQGYEPATERELFTLELSSLDQLPDALRLPSPRFACLLAWDAARIADAAIAQVADRLLDAGAVHFTCWGAGCQRVHDIIDRRATESGRNEAPHVIMTSWHADEPLAEALWDFLHASLPVEGYVEGCRSGLAISIGLPASTSGEIAQALTDSKGWTQRVLESDDGKHAA